MSVLTNKQNILIVFFCSIRVRKLEKKKKKEMVSSVRECER